MVLDLQITFVPDVWSTFKQYFPQLLRLSNFLMYRMFKKAMYSKFYAVKFLIFIII